MSNLCVCVQQENQQRDRQRQEQEREKEIHFKQKQRELVGQGHKPFYLKKGKSFFVLILFFYFLPCSRTFRSYFEEHLLVNVMLVSFLSTSVHNCVLFRKET